MCNFGNVIRLALTIPLVLCALSFRHAQGREQFTRQHVVRGRFEEWAPRDGSARATGLTFNVSYDLSVLALPRAGDIKATVDSVVAYYQANFSDPITVTVLLSNMNDGLGTNLTLRGDVSYSKYRAALAAHATTADDTLALSTVPDDSANPVNGNKNMTLTYPHLRALGFKANPGKGEFDCELGINFSLVNISATDTDPFDTTLAAVLMHELNEALGTASSLFKGSNLLDSIFPADLFRYSKSGRSFTHSANEESFFSIDGSNLLVRYNQLGEGDYGDFFVADAGQPIPRVQDFRATAGSHPVPDVELRLLDVVGFTFVGTPLPNLAFDAGVGLNAPAEIKPGSPLAVSATVLNGGIAAAGVFTVRFVLSKDRVPGASAIVLGEIPVSGLAIGASMPVAWNGNCPANVVGHFNIVAICDAAGAVAETNELDNVLSRSTQVTGAVNVPPTITSALTFSPNPATANSPVTFSAAATDLDADALDFFWDFGDSTTDAGPSPTHVFTTSGTFNVKLLVTDAFGGSATAAISVTVSVSVTKSSASKKKFAVNFGTGQGSIDITIANIKLIGAVHDGAEVSFVVGDVTKNNAHTIDRSVFGKNKAIGADIEGKFSYNAKQGSIRYTGKALGFDELLFPFGVTANSTATTVSIPIFFNVNNEFFGDSISFSYSVSSSGSGKGK